MNRKAFLLAMCVVLMWSTVASAFKLTLSLVTPLQMLWLAVATGVAILGAAAWKQQKLRPAWQLLKQSPGFFLLLAFLNPTAYYLILFAAYDILPAQQAQALNYTWAVMLSMLAVPFLGQTFTRINLFSIIIAYSGVLVIATQGELMALDFKQPLGVALGLGSSVFFSSYWILNTKYPHDPVITLLLCFGLSLPMLSGMMLWQNGFSEIPLAAVAGGVYIGAFEMSFAFLCWMSALRLATNTAQLSNLVYLAPPISLVLLAVIVGEEVLYSTLIGFALIIIGVLVQQIRQRPSSV
ncbi:DMT family transporter [Aliamphritea hakodatensis]|uniref:DMT family transporter n=1 Tax=Aliamphritea hakodatensis TaxID=2895352 RepID=UPI0022FDA5BB|nr:DMT family transporter [Aliamphritea hakodatensis]